MPGNGDDLFASAFIFEATFATNSSAEMWAHALDFGTQLEAEPFVNDLTNAMGKLPAVFRDTLDHVVLNVGDQTASAEELDGFCIMYSVNIQTRVENNDLEETVFHETIHVASETNHAQNACWLQAQKDDPGFITECTASRLLKEDLSESVLFVYALFNHPDRLPADVEARIKAQIPNRIAYLKQIPGFVQQQGETVEESGSPTCVSSGAGYKTHLFSLAS